MVRNQFSFITRLFHPSLEYNTDTDALADFCFVLAIHDRGWLSPNPQLNLPSTPRTTLTPGYESQQIPSSALVALKQGMKRIHPELAEKEILETRLCWSVSDSLY